MSNKVIKNIKKNKIIYIYLTLLIILLLIILFPIIFFGINNFNNENIKEKNLKEIKTLASSLQYNTFNKIEGIADSLSNYNIIKNYVFNHKNKLDDKNILLILNSVKISINASIVYLMDNNGLVIASTKTNDPDLTGNNYSFRPYFKESITGKNFIYPAIGITTKKRGLYFSSPIKYNNQIIGVTVIKYGLETIDKIMHEIQYPVILISPEGVIFATNQDGWLTKTLKKLTGYEILKLKRNQQFADIDFNPINIKINNDLALIENKNYLVTRYNFLLNNWELISFVPKEKNNYSLTKIQKNFIISIIVSSIILFITFFFILLINEFRIQVNKKYRLIVENINEGMVVLLDNLRIAFTNNKYLELTEYSLKEILKINIFNTVYEDDRKMVKEIFTKRIKGEDVPNIYEFRLKTKSGKLIWVQINAVKINWQNRPASLFFLLNITERKKIEIALKESEEKYRLLVESMKEGLVIIDKKFIITFVNYSFCKIIKKKEIEIIGLKVEEVFNVDKIDKFKNQIKKIITKKDDALQFEWIDKNNNKKTSLVMSSPFYDENKNFIGNILVFSDMTELVELQNRLIKSEKMESLGKLAGRVAHDLNNILSGIVSLPDLLLLELKEDNKIKETIEIIKKSGEKAAAIVSDLLTLSRSQIIKKDILNLNIIIEETIKSPTIEKYKDENSNIIIIFEPDKTLYNILGSKIYLENIIINLIVNAIEAMPNGGNIIIKTMNYKQNKKIISKDQILLIIEDSGIGISKEDCKKIFEPFYSKKNMGRSGTGLGLSIVWNLVKDHNGSIEVASKTGKGTIFKLYFPANHNSVIEKEKIELNNYKGKGEKILVIDDLDLQIDLAKSILTKQGYNVIGINEGNKAISYLKLNKIDLVLLDMILENSIEGKDVFRQILQNNPKQKIIIVTGFAEKTAIKELKKIKDVTILKKPYTIEELSIIVFDMLHN